MEDTLGTYTSQDATINTVPVEMQIAKSLDAKCPVCRQKVEMKRVVPLSDSIEASAPSMKDLESKGKMVRSDLFFFTNKNYGNKFLFSLWKLVKFGLITLN